MYSVSSHRLRSPLWQGVFRSRLWRFLLLLLGLLTLVGTAHAGSYYEANAPYRFGTGGASFGRGIDAATGAFTLGGPLGSVPGRVSFPVSWNFNSQDNSNGPLGKGTSLSTDYFIAPSAVLGAGYFELIEPGNRHFAFHSAPGGTDTNATDPEVLGAVLTFSATPPGDLTSTLRWKDGTKYFFDSGGALNRVEDRLGNYLTIDRNASGFATAITPANGPSASFSYGDNGLLSFAAVANAYWLFSYDANNRLSGVQPVSFPASSYTWTAYTRSDGVSLPLVLTVTDRTGVTQITNAYDSAGRVSSQGYADGGVLRPTYSAPIGASGYTTVTDPKGRVTRQDFTWNPSHFGYELTGTTNALGRVTTFGRSGPSHLVTAITDFRGRTITYGWDPTLGNQTSVTKPTASGGTVTWTSAYEPTYSKLIQATDPLGHTTTSTVEATTGNTTAVTDARGKTTAYTYSAQGDLLTVTNALNQTITNTYDDAGDLLTETDAASHVTTHEFDGTCRCTATVAGNGTRTEYSYDALNRLTQLAQRPRYAGTGNGLVTYLAYDAEGRRTSLQDPNGVTRRWSYDSKGRLFQEFDGLGRATTYTWDLNDNPVSVTDRKGQVKLAFYDAADRLTQMVFKRANGTTESSYTLAYNPTTDLTDSVTDSVAGTFSFSYDSLDRPLSESGPNGSCVVTLDDLDRRTSLAVSGQPLLTYSYDERNALVGLAQNGQVSTFTRDALGRLSDRLLPNGVATHRTFNADGTLASVTNGSETRLFWYDGAHNVTGERIGPVGGTLWSYGYDDYNRLTVADLYAGGYLTQVSGWTYDDAGNRLTQTVNGATDSYGCDANNALVSLNGQPLSYDANGNLTSDGTTTYTWDCRNRLVGLTRGGANPLTASFVYDWQGRRVSKTLNGVTTSLLNDGDDIVLESSGGVLTQTVQGPEKDQPIARGGLFYNQGLLGSVTALTDGSGAVVQQYSYDPWGNSTPTTGVANPIQYTGRENDGTGLMYYRARYYAPQWGRFISEDPIGQEGGQNQYVYCANNPLIANDPSGKFPTVPEMLAALGRFFKRLSSWLDSVAKDPATLEGLDNVEQSQRRDMAQLGGADWAASLPPEANSLKPMLSPYDVALGMDPLPGGQLQQFADYVGGKTMNDWWQLNEDFEEKFKQAMGLAPDVYFDLTGMDMSKAYSYTGPAGYPNNTNWEFQQILHNPDWYKKTKFFGMPAKP